jgi:hypothetical protein
MQPVEPIELVANPFALLINPADVVAQMESSERLRRLQSRVCRPLDKPLIPCAADSGDISEIVVDSRRIALI